MNDGPTKTATGRSGYDQPFRYGRAGMYTSGLLSLLLVISFTSLGLPLNVTVPLSLLIALTGQRFIALALDRRADTFDPVTFVAAYFLLNLGTRAVYILVIAPDSGRIGRVGYDDSLSSALWCATAAYTSFLLGFHSTHATGIRKFLATRNLRWPTPTPAARIALLSSIGFVVMVYRFKHGMVVGSAGDRGREPANGFLALVVQLIPAAWVASCIYLLLYSQAGKKRVERVLAILSLIYIAASIGITGGKQAMLEPILELLIVVHYTRKRLSLWQLAAIALPAALLAFSAVNFYRFVVVRQNGSPQTFEDIVSRTTLAAHHLTSESSTALSSPFDQMMGRQAGIDALALVMKYTPEPHPFRWGKPFVDALVAATVPRQLWREKPIYVPSRDFEQDYMGMPAYYDGHSSPQLISDLYENFGFAGVIGGMLIWGSLLKSFYLLCLPGPTRPGWVFFYALLIPICAHLMENGVGPDPNSTAKNGYSRGNGGRVYGSSVPKCLSGTTDDPQKRSNGAKL